MNPGWLYGNLHQDRIQTQERSVSDLGPLVSVGVPVRNGGASLARALSCLEAQTYSRIEVLISDNCSDDETWAVCSDFARRNRCWKIMRQVKPVTALCNFEYVLRQSKGEYFLWLAHDDWRPETSIEELVAAAVSTPSASLIIGDVYAFSRSDKPEILKTHTEKLSAINIKPFISKALYMRNNRCIPLYGMHQAKLLKSYDWIDLEYGPDVPLLTYLLVNGEAKVIEGGAFYYNTADARKTHRHRAKTGGYGVLRSFPEIRLSYACAVAALQNIPVACFRVEALLLAVIIWLARKSYLWEQRLSRAVTRVLR